MLIIINNKYNNMLSEPEGYAGYSQHKTPSKGLRQTWFIFVEKVHLT